MTDTGFKLSDGRDLIEIFQTGNSGIDTNFISSSYNKDLGQIFMAGNSGIVTGYTIYNGQDLGSKFESILPFTASRDAIATGVATGDKKYYYAIFVNNTTEQARYLQAITYNNIDSNLNMIVVGGGGGGGSSSDQISDGGGGGGAVWSIPTTIYSGISYDIYVGQGGYAGGTQGSSTGGEGGNSTVWRYEGGSGAYIINCLGGKPGFNDGAGDGGLIENPSGLEYNGGGGGDRVNGDSCTTPAFTDTTLPGYSSLVNAAPQYISTSYSGGGGGGKGNSENTSFSGGLAGFKGAGGLRGIENAEGTNGQNGRTDGEPGYGGGGGAGGFTRTNTNFNGGAGAGGIVIVYAPIIIPETNLPFSSYGASLYGSTSNTSGKRYCYAIFTNTTSSSKSVTTIKGSVTLNAIVVGGGGGGGGSKDDHSPGGGGGGGVYMLPFGTTNNQTYTVTVGSGGIGGPTGGSGTAGGTSQVTGPSATLTCTGGTGGTSEGQGTGGTPSWDTNFTGGNGGDRDNGDNSSYFYVSNTSFNKLDIPDQLVTEQPGYISYYYSGGGGGSKGSQNDVDYGGGYGGNTLVSNTSSGQGGLRGPQENLSTTYWNGRPGVTWGGGGGSGGYYRETPIGQPVQQFFFPGGNGYQGIVIIYAEIL